MIVTMAITTFGEKVFNGGQNLVAKKVILQISMTHLLGP